MITFAIPTLSRVVYAIDALCSIASQACQTPFKVLVLDNGCDQQLAAEVRRIAAGATVPVIYAAVLVRASTMPGMWQPVGHAATRSSTSTTT